MLFFKVLKVFLSVLCWWFGFGFFWYGVSRFLLMVFGSSEFRTCCEGLPGSNFRAKSQASCKRCITTTRFGFGCRVGDRTSTAIMFGCGIRVSGWGLVCDFEKDESFRCDKGG